MRDRIGFCYGDLSGRFPRHAGKPGSQNAGWHCQVNNFSVLPPPNGANTNKINVVCVFSVNFSRFILCNPLHKRDGMICHTCAEWKNYRPSANWFLTGIEKQKCHFERFWENPVASNGHRPEQICCSTCKLFPTIPATIPAMMKTHFACLAHLCRFACG